MTRWVWSVLLALCLTQPGAAWAGSVWSPMKGFPNGVVVVGTAYDRLVAVDASSGRYLWKKTVKGASSLQLYAQDNHVILIGPGPLVTARDGASGAVLWTYNLPADEVHPLVVESDRIYLQASSKASDKLVVLDLSGGKPIWEMRGKAVATVLQPDKSAIVAVEETAAAATPAESKPAKEKTGIVLRRFSKEGRELWTTPEFIGTSLSPPLAWSADIVVTTQHTHATIPAASPSPQAKEVAVDNLAVVDAETGKILWQRDIDEATEGELTVLEPYFFIRKEGALRAFDLKTGKQRWNVTLPPVAPNAKTIQISVGPLGNDSVYTLHQVAGEHPDDLPRFRMSSLRLEDGTESAHFDGQAKIELMPRVLDEGLLFGWAGDPSKKPSHQYLLLDPRSMTLKWYLPMQQPGDFAPMRIRTPAGAALLAMDDDVLLMVDPASGKVMTRILPGGDIASGPVLDGSRIVFGDSDSVLHGLDLAAGKPLWSLTTKPLFAIKKLPNLAFVVLLFALISIFIYQARGGRKLFIRRIAGLSAVDEAVGRATEMGKPVLYLTGLQDIDDIQTLSALSILGHVAKRTAEYETPLFVPCCRSVVMGMAQDVVKEAHLKVGRPDSYNRDNIRYLTDDQFGFVAGVDGIMLRDRPAANFYMGMYYAESLILAETGHSTGAIQIAGTAAPPQLPFFVAACDYTLIGEELYAASAYLSEDPLQVGSLKGQDVAKAIIMALIVISCILYPWLPQVKDWLSGS